MKIRIESFRDTYEKYLLTMHRSIFPIECAFRFRLVETRPCRNSGQLPYFNLYEIFIVDCLLYTL